MKYGIFRKAAAIFSFAVIIIMTVVFVFQLILPDSFYVDSGEKLEFASRYGNFISFDSSETEVEEVFSTKRNNFTAKAKLLGVFPLKNVDINYANSKNVIVCGTPFGVKMFTDGVLIVDFSEIETENGNCCPAAESGLKKGDLIKSIDGKEVFSNEDVAEKIEKSCGKSLCFLLDRDGEKITVSVEPEMLADQSGYKAGFWVRDSAAGIGTLTFYDPKSLVFGGLGHAVCDVDTGTVLPFSSGEIVPASITKIKKGFSGAPGELGGTFTGKGKLGTVKINNETGLYGTLDYTLSGISMPIAHKQEIYEGPAVILSTVEGTETTEYDIVIEKISLSDNSLTKNMVIKVTDEELIELTGGIVQGMSGSPIIQDGKLIGAVTHVLVNDPTRGYGIFIENMLDAAG